MAVAAGDIVLLAHLDHGCLFSFLMSAFTFGAALDAAVVECTETILNIVVHFGILDELVFFLQEGLQISLLQEIVHSMAQTAREAGVEIVAGDTKVVNGNGELYINTAGVGFVPEEREVSAYLCCDVR